MSEPTETTATADYDLEDVYDEQIAPLMTQIIAICREYGIPMVASFAYALEEDRHSFVSTVIDPEDTHPDRMPDKFNDVRRVLLRGTSY